MRFLFCLCCLCTLLDGTNRTFASTDSISPAVNLLKQLADSYVSDASKVTVRKDITNFVLTGTYGPYKYLNYKRIVNDTEREIMYVALITAALKPEKDNGIFKIYLENLSSIQPTSAHYIADYKHRLTGLMVIYLAVGKASGFSLKKIIKDFYISYASILNFEYVSNKEIEDRFRSMSISLPFKKAYAAVFKEEHLALRMQGLYRGNKMRMKTASEYDWMMKQLLQNGEEILRADTAAMRIQTVYRGHAVRKNAEFEYDKMMRLLTATDSELTAVKHIQAVYRGHAARKSAELEYDQMMIRLLEDGQL